MVDESAEVRLRFQAQGPRPSEPRTGLFWGSEFRRVAVGLDSGRITCFVNFGLGTGPQTL